MGPNSHGSTQKVEKMNWSDKLYDFASLHSADRPAEHQALVFDVQRFSIHDGGGIRTNIFLKGCPLNCLWCQNPESLNWRQDILFVESQCIQCRKCVNVCPNDAIQLDANKERVVGINRDKCILCGACFKTCYAGAISIVGRWLTVDDVIALIERDRDFYTASGGGVTFTGGEPTGQPVFLLAALQALRARGVHTALETCLHVSWEQLEPLLPYVNLLLTDIKHMNSAQHKQLTGLTNELILDNFQRLHHRKAPVRVRFPLLPGLNDSEENVQATISFIAQLKNIQGVDVLPYNRLGMSKCRHLGHEYALTDLVPPSLKSLEDVAVKFRKYFADVTIGG